MIPFLGAIVTDVGAPTSHMASICREFNIPTVVNVGNATTTLNHGDEVTLFAGDDNRFTIYAGIAHDLLRQQRQSALKVREPVRVQAPEIYHALHRAVESGQPP